MKSEAYGGGNNNIRVTTILLPLYVAETAILDVLLFRLQTQCKNVGSWSCVLHGMNHPNQFEKCPQGNYKSRLSIV